MKRGRPKNPEKLRIKTIKLTAKATYILEDIKRKRKEFNFSRYISEHIILDFENDGAGLKYDLGVINDKIKDLYAEQELIVTKLRNIRQNAIKCVEEN